MYLTTPLFLLFGALLIAGHLAAYFLRARHPPLPVSSLMLWSGRRRTADKGRRLRIPRLPPLFFLELLALVALAFAGATPLIRRGGAPVLTVVLDPSLSMTARVPSGGTVHTLAADALRRELRRHPPPSVRLIAADPDAPRLVGLLSPSDVLAYVRDPAHFSAPSDTLSGALQLADRLRSPGAPILCLTDHAVSPLPPATRLRAFGSPLPNAALSYAARTLTEAGSDALLLLANTYPNDAAPVVAHLRADPSFERHLPCDGPAFLSLPHGTGPLHITLPDDALAADNSLVLLPPTNAPVPVTLSLSDPALSNLTARALRATGLATPSAGGSGGESPRRLFIGGGSGGPAPRPLPASATLLLVSPSGTTRLSAAPPLVEPGVPLLEGLDFTGLAWTLGEASLPGKPLVSSGVSPILTVEESGSNLVYRLAATPSDPFFRSAAWPSLLWNLLHRLAQESSPIPPQIHHGTPESDLTGCATLTLDGPAASPAAASAASSPLPTLLLGLLALALLALRLALLRRAAGRRLFALALLALVAALFRPALPLPHKAGMVIAVVDRSASLPASEREAQGPLLEEIARRRTSDERFGVVSFGAEASIEQLPGDAPFAGFSAAHDPDGSDLAGALRLAEGLVPAGTPARIVLLSDGLAEPPVVPCALPVDYRPQGAPPPTGPALLRLDAPLRLRTDEGLLATAWLHSPTNATVAYRFLRGTNLVAAGTLDLPAGATPVSFRDAPQPAGTSVYTLRIGGTEGGPSARFLVTRSTERPLLVVPASPSSRLPSVLAEAGLAIEPCHDPASFEFTPATLAAYSGMLIENRPASDFGPVALSNIAVWVSEARGGLALTGGRNAFGSGGYYKSPLEPILPVTLELRNERRKFSMALAVALDRSGSMAAPVGGGRTKMDLADIATVESLGLLAPTDEIAVFAVDSEPHVILPLTPVEKALSQRNRILAIRSQGGGIYVHAALVAAIDALKDSAAAIRHVLLFSDACDSEEPGDYTTLVGLARDMGITVSVVGLGTPTDPDADLLRDIAAIGGGECFFSADASEIPRLFTQDTILLSRNAIVEESTVPRFTTALPFLSDTLPASAPPLGGYNLCYAHPASTVVALSSDDNLAPLVAFRPVGAGRVIAFTGEADGPLSGPFARWDRAAEFHAALARHIVGGDASLPPGITIAQRLTPTALELSLYVDDPLLLSGPPSVRVLRTRSSGTETETVPFAWVAADCLSVVLPLRASETLLPLLRLPGRDDPILLAPARLPFSPETVPDLAHRGEKTLSAIARATGGTRLLDPADVWTRLPRGARSFPLASWLYLLAASFLLADILRLRLGPSVVARSKSNGWRQVREGKRWKSDAKPILDPATETRKTGDEKRETGDEKRETGNEKRETGDEKRETGDEKREMGDEKREKGNGKREKETGKHSSALAEAKSRARRRL